MRSRILEVVLVVAAAVALCVGLVAWVEVPGINRSTRITPPVDVRSVCVPVTDQATAYVLGGDAAGPLGQDRGVIDGPQVLGSQDSPLVVTGSSPIAGAMVGTEGGVTTATACGSPQVQGFITLPDQRHASLLVVNSDAVEASIDLQLFGPDGEIRAVGARGVAVGAGASREVALGVLAGGQDGPLGVSWTATTGRATVVVRSSAEASLTSAGSGETGEQLVLGPVRPGGGDITVVLTNPSTSRVDASLTVLGPTGPFTPVGGEAISIPPASTVSVPLTDALAGGAGHLRVDATAPVGAGLSVGTEGTVNLIQPSVEAMQLAAAGPVGGQLVVGNPSGETATVQVGEDTLEVPAGATVTADLPTTHGLVRLDSSRPVVGGVVHAAADSSFVVPLQDVGQVGADPVDAVVDPGLR